jgi:hypothetical protein
MHGADRRRDGGDRMERRQGVLEETREGMEDTGRAMEGDMRMDGVNRSRDGGDKRRDGCDRMERRRGVLEVTRRDGGYRGSYGRGHEENGVDRETHRGDRKRVRGDRGAIEGSG